jgi:hypothetical protein
MSRSGYCDDYDSENSIYLWRGAVTRAINGKRGQAFLRGLLVALDAKTEKTLVANALTTEDQNHCALGVIGHLRGIKMSVGEIDECDGPEVTREMAHKLNIASALALEIVFLNDEAGSYNETDEQRFERVRNWVSSMIHGGAP